MGKKLKLGKVLYATVENEGTDDAFINTDSDPAALSGFDDTTILHKYQLVGKVKAVNKTEVIDI